MLRGICNMLDSLYGVFSVLLGTLIATFILEFRAKKLINQYKKELKQEAEAWLNSETGQKAIFQIGAIIGNGAKAGLGMTTKSGKFRWQDLAGQVLSQWIQGRMPQTKAFNQPEQQNNTDLGWKKKL